MNLRTIVAAAAFATAVSVGTANALPYVTGTISIIGPNTIDYTGDSVTFLPGSLVGAATGSFLASGFNLGDAVTMRNQGSPVSYAGPLATNDLLGGSDLGCGAGCVFSAVSPANTAQFEITGLISLTEVAGVSLDILASGWVYLTGYEKTFGTFNFGTEGPGNTEVTFSATTIAVPGPILGAGLPGLIAACGGLVLLARRRRSKMA